MEKVKKDVSNIDFKGLSDAYVAERESRDDEIKSQNGKISNLEKLMEASYSHIDEIKQRFSSSGENPSIITCYDNKKEIGDRKYRK